MGGVGNTSGVGNVSRGNIQQDGEVDRQSASATLNEEHRFWTLIIVPPAEAPAGRAPSHQDSSAPLQIQTDFQEGSPSHSHSFKRLSSAARVLFLPSPPSLLGPSFRRHRSRHRRRGEMTEGQERRKDAHKAPQETLCLLRGLKWPSDKLLEIIKAAKRPCWGCQTPAQQQRTETRPLPPPLLDGAASAQLLF